MQNTSYIKLKQDVLVELNMDDTYLIDTSYTIINDSLNNKKSFAFTNNDINGTSNQLYQVDNVLNKWVNADPDTQSLITYENYNSPALYTYNKVRLYFPLNFQFNLIEGFYLGIYAYDYQNEELYWLSNFYIDLSISAHFNMIQNTGSPIRYQDKLWSKYVDILIPSVYSESRKRNNNSPIAGTINYNLTNGVGLSQVNPIFFDFKFIESSYTISNIKTYVLGTSGLSSCSQLPSYDNISTTIKHASDGDYFELYGSVQSSSALFADFMQVLEDTNNRSYVTFTVDVFEENVPTDSVEYVIFDNFDKKIKFRPILLYTSTTAYLVLTMKITNTVDGSAIIKSATYGMLPDETAKYGRTVTSINVSNAFKPKIVNAKPDQIVISNTMVNSIKQKIQRVDNIVYKTVPVLSNVYGIVIKDATQTIGVDKYYGQDDLECVIHPFDNVFKFKIAKEITKGSPVALDIDLSNTEIKMVFKSNQDILDLNLYTQSNDVNISNGIFVFAVNENNITKIKKIANENNKFYIILKNNDISTVLYSGRFILSDSKEYIMRANSAILKTPLQDQQQVQTPVITSSNGLPAINQSVIELIPNNNVFTTSDSSNSITNVSGNNTLSNSNLSDLGFSSTQFTLVL